MHASSRIKILFLENGSSGGGSFESLYQLVTRLPRDRFDPIVVFVNETPFYQRLQAAGIRTFLVFDPVYSLHALHLVKVSAAHFLSIIDRYMPWLSILAEMIVHCSSIIMLARMIRRERIDVLHLNNQSIRDCYGVIVARYMRVPCVSYLRSVRVAHVNRIKIAFLNRAVAQFIANAHFTREYFARLGIAKEKISVIANAIAPDTLAPLDIREIWHLPNSARYLVGCVGNLLQDKGQEFLLDAFVAVQREEPDTYLFIVGDGAHRRTLEALARVRGIASHVIFTGYVSEARRVIAGLDLLVLPSAQETFGRALLEAMVAEVPIVATRTGGIPEVITHEQNGLLVTYGDCDGMRAAILTLLRNAQLAQRLIEQGKRIVREKFGMEAHLRRVEAIYESVAMHH